jgi:ribokinase
MLRLLERISRLKVSVLPDFFADRILKVPSIQRLSRQVILKANAGGGSLRGLSQTEIRGGNATNLAFALSSLSVRTRLYCVGDNLTRAVITTHPENCEIKIIEGKPGYTTAFEFPHKGRIVNVMLSDVGDVGYFDGKQLSGADLHNLGKSDCIALVNWSCNLNGNELAEKIFSLRGRNRRLNFLDPADLSGAEERIRTLVKNIVAKGDVDVVSLNENEARILARKLSVGRLPISYRAKDLRRISAALHDGLSVTIDIHTPIGSASSIGHETYWANSFGMIGGVVTGAGDAWDAGDITGHLIRLEVENRLRLANACAYLYVAGKNAEPPNLSSVIGFLRAKRILLM